MILVLLALIAATCGATSQRVQVGPTYVGVEWIGGHSIDNVPCPSWPDEFCYFVVSWADGKPVVDYGAPTADGLGP